MSEQGRCFSIGLGNFVWASGGGRGKVGGSRKKFTGGERKTEGQMRLFRARGMAEFSEVASGSATQSLWLRHGKVKSQVSGIDRSQFPGRRAVGEIKGGGRQGRRANDRVKKRVCRFG